MKLALDIPPGYAQHRPQPEYVKLAKHSCPDCGWQGFAPHNFRGEPLTECPHKDGSPMEEWR